MSFPIKIAFNGELRRFLCASTPSYVDVVVAVQQMFPRLGASGFSVKYEDEENELITVASELELAEAVAVCKQLQRKTLKLIVVSRDEDWVSVAPEQAHEKEEPLKEKPVIEQVVDPVQEPVIEQPEQPEVETVEEVEEVKEPEPAEVKEPKEEPFPTKEELVAALMELAADERVKAGIPKLAETALSDASLDALLDPSLPIAELLRNIVSSVPEIASNPCVGQLLAAVARGQASECLARVRERLGVTAVPIVRAFRPMFLEALPALVDQLPMLVESVIQRFETGCCGGGARPFMPCFMGQFPFVCPTEEQAEEELPGGKKEAVHRGIICDGCGANPLVGVRFQCTVCPNFDLCKACEAKGEHAPSHPMLQLRGTADAGEAVHQNVQCNSCGVVPIRGPRFKCTVCHDFDLCDACEQKGDHDHPLLKMRRPMEHRGRGRFGPRPWMRHAQHFGPMAQHFAPSAASQEPCAGLGPLFRMFAGRGGCKRSNAGSAFVSDVTLPDGAEVPVGVEMVKTWKFRNDGQQVWPQGSSLVLKRCRGEFETAPLPISRLPNPGEEVEVSVTLKALQPGRGRVCYRLVDNNGVPFGKLWADVVAVAQEVKAQAEPVKSQPAKETPKEPAKETPKEPETPKPQPQRFEYAQHPHKFEIALTALAGMGFTDRKRNIKILNKEKGNLERTITRLLEDAM